MVTRRHHLLGEDAPRWLVVGIGVLGATVVGSGAWAFVSARSPDGGRATAAPLVTAVTTTAAPTVLDTSVTPTVATTAAPATTSPSTSSTTIPPAPTTTTPPATTTPPSPSPITTLDPVAAGLCPAPVTLLFEFGMTHPRVGADDPTLGALAAWTVQNPIGRLLVTGHASSIGQDVDNLLLSLQRATAAVNLLRAAGVADTQMAVRAAGEFDPLPFDDPESAANQRVVIRGDAPVCEEAAR